jgi:hypothetical protein
MRPGGQFKAAEIGLRTTENSEDTEVFLCEQEWKNEELRVRGYWLRAVNGADRPRAPLVAGFFVPRRKFKAAV